MKKTLVAFVLLCDVGKDPFSVRVCGFVNIVSPLSPLFATLLKKKKNLSSFTLIFNSRSHTRTHTLTHARAHAHARAFTDTHTNCYGLRDLSNLRIQSGLVENGSDSTKIKQKEKGEK